MKAIDNYLKFKEKDSVPIKAWVKGVWFEEEAQHQVLNVAKLPFIYKHIAVMPDVHWGKGATIGSVIATKGAIIPAAVGVDIGCGMNALKTSLKAEDLPDNLSRLRSEIERLVPHGRTNNGMTGDRGAWYEPVQNDGTSLLMGSLQGIIKKHPKIAKPAERMPHHAGTLGGGNHFVEICLDEEGFVWIMLHSGSRGIGNAIGSYFIQKAKEDMKRWFINLPDADLAYIPQGSELFTDYCDAVRWAQMFALHNRRLMVQNVKAALNSIGKGFTCKDEVIECHHNYIAWERHFGANVMITRKGAVNAEKGVMGIIPGSMGAKSFIVRGKGNRESFNSCSHGAGRVMSRRAAREKYTVTDQENATRGVECRKDKEVIDEIPMAYKNIDQVMNAQNDLVDVVHTLKQVVCVKG